MNTEQILKFINENPHLDLKGAGFQRKSVNGQLTEELSLALYVGKKKPLNEVPASQIIPTGIYVEDIGWVKTDVMEGETVLEACSDCAVTGSRFTTSSPPVDARLRPYRGIQRPLIGGISIVSIPNQAPSTHGNATYQGTLGFIAVDELDGTLVGVTNHHVGAFNSEVGGGAAGTYAHDRVTGSTRFGTTTDVYDFHRHRVEQGSRLDFANEITMRLGSTYDPYYLYEDGRYQGALTVGYLKRYMPITTGNNTIDCSIIGLNQQTATNIVSVLANNGVTASTNIGNNVFGAASWQILGHDLMGNQRYYPFATTNEIDSMTSTQFINEATAASPNIVMAGRTTGLKGQPNNPNSSVSDSFCILRMLNTSFIVNSIDLQQTKVNFTNCLSYRWQTCTNLASTRGGDSGSVILGRFNRIWKIVGIHFAGVTGGSGSGEGRGIRIDHIAPLLRIRPYMGQAITNPVSNGATTSRTIVARNKQSAPFIRHTDGRVYYQMGTTTAQADVQNVQNAVFF